MREWLARVLNEALDGAQPLSTHLHDGTLLCRLLNTIRPGLVPRFHERGALNAFRERENIETCVACW